MTTDTAATALVTLGAIFAAGLVADVVGRRTRLPRVTLLLLLGVAVGPLGVDVVPPTAVAWFPFVTHLALVMVAFLLGGELTRPLLREHGRTVLVASLVVVAATAAVVAVGLLLLGWPPAVALLLGAIATSTDPAAVSDVGHELRARGPFTRTLLGIVAVDDAWGIAAMSFALALVVAMQDAGASGPVLRSGLVELVGALVVGAALGVPMALLTGRVREGEPTQAEALGGVLLCGGVALWLDVSFLLAAMTMGVVVANLARHHRRPFRAIEGIEWPFMVLFFVLSGASLELGSLGAAAGLTVAYVGLRAAGRLVGGWLGARATSLGRNAVGIGTGLLPQAGVAIGMALVAAQELEATSPQLAIGSALLTATVAGTVVFEVVGPILTRRAIVRSGEAAGD